MAVNSPRQSAGRRIQATQRSQRSSARTDRNASRADPSPATRNLCTAHPLRATPPAALSPLGGHFQSLRRKRGSHTENSFCDVTTHCLSHFRSRLRWGWGLGGQEKKKKVSFHPLSAGLVLAVAHQKDGGESGKGSSRDGKGRGLECFMPRHAIFRLNENQTFWGLLQAVLEGLSYYSHSP